MPDRELLVRILGDDRDLQRALGNTDKRLTAIDNRTASFGRNISRAFAFAGISIGTGVVVAEAQKAINAASDLNEQIDRTRVILGDNADAVIEWSETTAKAFGISQRAALTATSTFAGLFKTVGVQEAQAAKLSRALVELAADLASLQNTSVEEALAALRSGLAGEAEPLRRFNIFLSESRVQQEAFAETGKRAASQLTNQEKALARYNIILRDSTVAQGNFADTSDNLANQQRILKAQIDDLEAAIGQVLLPTMTDFVTTLNDAATAAQELAGFLQGLEELAPIEIPIDIPVTLLFKGRTPSGIGDIFDKVGEEIGDSLEALVGGGKESIKNLEQLFRGEAGRGLRFFPAPIEDAVDDAVQDTKDRADRTEKATGDLKKAEARRRKAFDEFVKGQGLKLDKAQLTKGMNDDLAVLRDIEAAILRRIQAEGRTFALVSQLTSVRQQIASVVEQQADEAERAAEEALNATFDALSLDIDMARATKSLADDQAALRALEQAILRRISVEGQTTDLMRQLFNVRQEQKDVAQRLRDQQRERRQGRQFEELGLTSEGEERAPSARSLRQRGETLEERIKGTALDTSRNRQILENAARVLSGQFGKVGREVRQAIKRMFDEIADALKDEDDVGGQITPGGIRPLQRLVAGANLTEEQLAILQRNMQRRRRGRPINAFGVDFDSVSSTSGTFKAGGPNIVIEPQPINLFIDGEKITNIVVKRMQKTGKRRTNRRGGSTAGRGAVL